MADSMYPRKILVVDPDPVSLKYTENLLAKLNITVVTTQQAVSALYLFNTQIIDCVVAMFDLDEMTALTLVQKMRKTDNEAKRHFSSLLLISKDFPLDSQALLGELPNVEMLMAPPDRNKLMLALQKQNQGSEKKSHVNDMMNGINQLIDNGHSDKALAALKEKLPNLGKQGPKIFADSLERATQLESAVAVQRQREKKDPDAIGIKNDLGRLYLKMGKFEESQSYFEECDKRAPKNIERIGDMAALYLHMKHPEKTVEKYKELIGLSPEDKDIKFDMINELKKAGFDSEAENFLNDVSEPKEMISYYNNKGVMLVKQEKIEEALAEYAKAIDFFPDFSEAYRIYFNMALASYRLGSGHMKDVAHYVGECLRLNPSYDKALAMKRKLKL